MGIRVGVNREEMQQNRSECRQCCIYREQEQQEITERYRLQNSGRCAIKH